MSTKFKTLYEFTIPKTEEVDETTETTLENGEIVKVTKKVKKEIAVAYCLKKPNSTTTNVADLFYHTEVNFGVRAGLMSTAYLAKTIGKDDGNLSDDERERGRGQLSSWYAKELELATIEDKLKAATPPNEEDIQAQARLLKEISEIKKEIQFLELRQQNLFESSAEARARKRLLLWWILNLPHKKEGENWEPLFKGTNMSEREDSYDTFEETFVTDEERLFFSALIQKISWAVSLWFGGQAGTQADFDKADKYPKPEESKE